MCLGKERRNNKDQRRKRRDYYLGWLVQISIWWGKAPSSKYLLWLRHLHEKGREPTISEMDWPKGKKGWQKMIYLGFVSANHVLGCRKNLQVGPNSGHLRDHNRQIISSLNDISSVAHEGMLKSVFSFVFNRSFNQVYCDMFFEKWIKIWVK